MSQTLCFKCMESIPARDAVCPHCGYDNHIRENGPGMLGEVVLNNQYQVGRVLGRGGFGITYLAYDLFLERKVAIKEYYPAHLALRGKDDLSLNSLTGSEEDFAKGRQRALKESRMAAALGQINGVVQVYNVFPANNTIYIVMEYVDGNTLAGCVKANGGSLSLPAAMELLDPVYRALSTLHKQKVIHRDVKPENIMVRRANRQGVLLDFGAARVLDDKTLSSSSAVVSPGFAPPEQYNSSLLDGRIDQYALAGTVYYTLTGQRPPDVMMRFSDSNALRPVRAFKPDMPERVDAVIAKAMSLRADDRYDDMDQFWQALLSAAEGKAEPRPAFRPAAAPAAANQPAAARRPRMDSVGNAPVDKMPLLRQPLQVSPEAKSPRAAAQAPAHAPAAAVPAGEKRKNERKGGGKVAIIAVVLLVLAGIGSVSEKMLREGKTLFPAASPTPIPPKCELTIDKNTLTEYNGDVSTLVMPSEIVHIGNRAFVYENDLVSVKNLSGIETIGDDAFSMCTGLRTIELPIGLKSIGKNAFYNCTSLTSITFPEGLETMGNFAFQRSGLTTVSIPSTLKTIPLRAFDGCAELTEVFIAEGVTIIEHNAFNGCTKLKYVYLPSTITEIGVTAFNECPSLECIYVPRKSYAYKFCKENDLPVKYID